MSDISRLYSKYKVDNEFNFDGMIHFPISYYLGIQDVNLLHKIAMDPKLNAKPKEKYKFMDQILKQRGFTRFHAGTNRLVYKCDFDDTFLLKVGIDKIGISDNPKEFHTQHLLKPFCTKVFDVSQCGTVAMVERVQPIKNRAEFSQIGGQVFDLLYGSWLGKYVMEDIGSEFFMNWGIRLGFGPVLLDYPYVYILDGKKLKCTKLDVSGQKCDGEIDYDAGLNTLICEKCGKRYTAKQLGSQFSLLDASDIILKGENEMENFKVISVYNGVQYVVGATKQDTHVMPEKRFEEKPAKKSRTEMPFKASSGNVINNNIVISQKREKVVIADTTPKVEEAKPQITSVESTVTVEPVEEVKEVTVESKEEEFEKEVKEEQKEIEEASTDMPKNSNLKDRFEEIQAMIDDEAFKFNEKMVKEHNNADEIPFTHNDREKMIEYVAESIMVAFNLSMNDAANVVREQIEKDYPTDEESGDKYEKMADSIGGSYDASPSIQKIKSNKLKDF